MYKVLLNSALGQFEVHVALLILQVLSARTGQIITDLRLECPVMAVLYHKKGIIGLSLLIISTFPSFFLYIFSLSLSLSVSPSLAFSVSYGEYNNPLEVRKRVDGEFISVSNPHGSGMREGFAQQRMGCSGFKRCKFYHSSLSSHPSQSHKEDLWFLPRTAHVVACEESQCSPSPMMNQRRNKFHFAGQTGSQSVSPGGIHAWRGL